MIYGNDNIHEGLEKLAISTAFVRRAGQKRIADIMAGTLRGTKVTPFLAAEATGAQLRRIKGIAHGKVERTGKGLYRQVDAPPGRRGPSIQALRPEALSTPGGLAKYKKHQAAKGLKDIISRLQERTLDAPAAAHAKKQLRSPTLRTYA